MMKNLILHVTPTLSQHISKLSGNTLTTHDQKRVFPLSVPQLCEGILIMPEISGIPTGNI